MFCTLSFHADSDHLKELPAWCPLRRRLHGLLQPSARVEPARVRAPLYAFPPLQPYQSINSLNPEPDFERIIKPLLEREPLELDDAADMDLDDEISEIKQFVSLFWC